MMDAFRNVFIHFVASEGMRCHAMLFANIKAETRTWIRAAVKEESCF